jgi:hypothetical protein
MAEGIKCPWPVSLKCFVIVFFLCELQPLASAQSDLQLLTRTDWFGSPYLVTNPPASAMTHFKPLQGVYLVMNPALVTNQAYQNKVTALVSPCPKVQIIPKEAKVTRLKFAGKWAFLNRAMSLLTSASAFFRHTFIAPDPDGNQSPLSGTNAIKMIGVVGSDSFTDLHPFLITNAPDVPGVTDPIFDAWPFKGHSLRGIYIAENPRLMDDTNYLAEINALAEKVFPSPFATPEGYELSKMYKQPHVIKWLVIVALLAWFFSRNEELSLAKRCGLCASTVVAVYLMMQAYAAFPRYVFGGGGWWGIPAYFRMAEVFLLTMVFFYLWGGIFANVIVSAFVAPSSDTRPVEAEAVSGKTPEPSGRLKLVERRKIMKGERIIWPLLIALLLATGFYWIKTHHVAHAPAAQGYWGNYVVQGIVMGKEPIATINNVNFMVGQTAWVAVEDHKTLIKCIDIEHDHVVIQQGTRQVNLYFKNN